MPNQTFCVTIRLLAMSWVAAIAAGSYVVPAHAQQPQNGASAIYTCIDAAGRQITADRPIASCLDRDQRILSNQGWVLRVVPPVLTDAQRAAQQEKERQAQLMQEFQQKQDRVNQMLLIRYPTQAAHEAGRRAALAQMQLQLSDARQQLETLNGERTELANQMAGYAQNPEDAPAQLKRKTANNAQAIQTQQQLITGYQAEINRINVLFDAEDKRLTPMWQKTQPTNAAASISSE